LDTARIHVGDLSASDLASASEERARITFSDGLKVRSPLVEHGKVLP
jgi:hypothetical protein